MLYVFGYLVLLVVALVFNAGAHKLNKRWDEDNGYDYYRE